MQPARHTARLFLALWPPPGVQAALADLQRRWQWPQATAPVPPERLHVTLHFLGPVPVERAAAFRDALSVPFDPHELRLAAGRCRVWPGGIAVLELDAPPALQRLHAALADALRGLDWPVEGRRYRPHVTFARRAQGARPPAEADLLGLPEWAVTRAYVLVHSVPQRGYEVVHEYLCR